MMAILCENHKYLWGRITLDHIIDYVAFVGCTNCYTERD